MFQKIFYSNNPLQYWIVILLGFFGMTISMLYSDSEISLHCSIFSDWCGQLMINPKLGVLFSYIILYLTAFGLISINKEFGDIMGILLPSVVLTLFFNLLTPTVLLINGIIILPIFIFVIKLLVNLYEKKRVFSELLYLGFISGMIAMINVDFIVILLVIILGLIILRPFYFKEHIILIISFTLPYLFLDSILFLFFDTHVFNVIDINLVTYKFDYSLFTSSLYPLIIFLLFTFFVYNRILNSKVELKKIKSRKIFVWINFSMFLIWIWILLTSKLLLIYILILLLAVSFSVVVLSLPNKLHSKLLLVILFILNAIIFVAV